MSDDSPSHQPPKKYHSERASRTNSRSNSNSDQQQNNSNNRRTTEQSSSQLPQPSPSPPPTPSCAHIASLDINMIRNRLRSRTFQNGYKEDQLDCVDCNVHFPKNQLWMCLHCNKIDAARCGRHDKHHSKSHFQSTGHTLAIHLGTRVIWCYAEDAEVPDEYNNDPKQTITPQLIRSALDKEDAQPDAEDDAAGQPAEAEQDEDAYKAYYTNPQGGMTGLSNLGNTCFFNAGVQALLHCPPLIAFFVAPPAHREAERRALAMLDCRTAEHVRNQSNRLQLLQDFSTLLHKVWSGRYNLCVPTDLLKDLLIINPFFRGYGQHDAQELIRSMLDNMHEGNRLKIEYEYDLSRKLKQQAEDEAKHQAEREKEEQEQAKLAAARIKRNTSSSSTASSDDGAMDESDGSSSSSATPPKKPTPPAKPRFPDCSVISDLFQGTLESRVTCKACGAVSLTKDPFYDLSLEIPKESQLKKISAERGEAALTPQASKGFFASLGNYLGVTSPTLSLETCLHSFCTSDSLLQKDQYKCDKCKDKVDAVKILSLGAPQDLPEILTLHIKRFSHNSYFGSKIGRHVTFPLYNLDVAPYLTPDPNAPQKRATPTNNSSSKSSKKGHCNGVSSSSPSHNPNSPALYNLFAIVRHMGSVNGGHYIAYCRSHVTGKWFEFDDKIVTEMSEEKIAKIEAYILFYRRTHPVQPLQRILKQIDAATIPNLPASPNPNPPPVRYISKYWLKKMEVFGRPEPIDNRDLCCSHGLPKPLPYDGGDRAVAITPAGWDALFHEYGGGPIVDSHVGQVCEPCQLPQQRKFERARIAEVDAIASRQSEDDPFFLIHAGWLTQWRTFVSQNGVRPGPISNHLLFAEGAPHTPNHMLPDLHRGNDYRALHGLVWQELWKLYGGGPAIERPTADIYVLERPTKHLMETDAEEEENAGSDTQEQQEHLEEKMQE